MPTDERIDSLEESLTDWLGPANASTLLQLLGARPYSSDVSKNPVVTVSLIADLHDELEADLGHELTDVLLEMVGHPASFWVPTCSRAS